MDFNTVFIHSSYPINPSSISDFAQEAAVPAVGRPTSAQPQQGAVDSVRGGTAALSSVKGGMAAGISCCSAF